MQVNIREVFLQLIIGKVIFVIGIKFIDIVIFIKVCMIKRIFNFIVNMVLKVFGFFVIKWVVWKKSNMYRLIKSVFLNILYFL